MNNKLIRSAMKRYIMEHGPQDTRVMIARFAATYHTTKQRISGNLSCMSCIEGSITIISNKPHSIMY